MRFLAIVMVWTMLSPASGSQERLKALAVRKPSTLEKDREFSGWNLPENTAVLFYGMRLILHMLKSSTLITDCTESCSSRAMYPKPHDPAPRVI